MGVVLCGDKGRASCGKDVGEKTLGEIFNSLTMENIAQEASLE